MQKVLISFIGTGRKAQGGGKEEYQKAIYQIPNRRPKESSLITSVLFNELKPDKLIVIGTPQSIWAELSKINPELLESGEVYERIWEETWEDKSVVKKETLKEWETYLKEKLNTQISLNLVDNDAIDSIVEILYKELPEKVKEVYLDITHAFRHFPLIAAFALPALKYIKAFEKLTLIYGKLAKPPEKSPVIFLDTPNKLLELLEAISLTQHAGNFEKFASILGNNKIEDLYLKVETNRRISNSTLNSLEKELLAHDITQKMAADFLKKEVIPNLRGDNLAIRMAKRARFFAERNQFLKAYTLIFEALVNTQPEYLSYEDKKKSLEALLNKEEKNIYNTIRRLRNIIAHGDNKVDSDLKGILQNKDKLKEWVYKGFELVKKLSNSN
ncbi:MAG: TIGR02221 family CRISPR-associated protein [Aquificota bacterium]